MKNIIWATLLGSTMTVGAAMGATGGGNGGDVVRCVENGQEVYRTLDSVVMANHPFYNPKLYQSSDEAIEAITAKFRETLPFMGIKFERFLETYENKVSEKRDAFWIESNLYDIEDENLHVKIPAHCDQEPIQAVNLVKEPFTRYYYDSSVISLIEGVDAEFSWLMIHEWLRDYIDDADVIRIINSYLHSEDFLLDSEKAVEETLNRLGIRYGKGISASELEFNLQMMRSSIDKVKHRMNDVEKELEKFLRGDRGYRDAQRVRNKFRMLSGFLIDLYYIADYTSEFEPIVMKINSLREKVEKAVGEI